MDKSAKIINSQLDRAVDFKYFALLGAFFFFLDYFLILRINTPLLQMKYSVLTEEIK